MKGFRNDLLAILLITTGLTACEKGLETYHGKSVIYFTSNRTSFLDTGFVSFGFSGLSQMDSIISIPISAMGETSAGDRTFKVVANNDSSTAKAGVHYDALPEMMIIPAGSVGGTLKLKLHRTPDMQTIPVALFLQLEPNEHFQTDLRSFVNGSKTCRATTYKLWIDDMLTQPLRWNTAYMGTFSKKKIYLTATTLGLDIQETIKLLNSTDGPGSTAALNAQIAWGRSMKLYLNEQTAAGTPVYEDNGVLMAMGSSI